MKHFTRQKKLVETKSRLLTKNQGESKNFPPTFQNRNAFVVLESNK